MTNPPVFDPTVDDILLLCQLLNAQFFVEGALNQEQHEVWSTYREQCRKEALRRMKANRPEK